ncbi:MULTISPECIES: ABC transporter permease [Rhodococcus]|jgi:ABC-2 type transport system permease protein|uniref:Transport permease protein n=1 Tax=Rhodococcoides yunnanense TaxID=278209 RepID=A0ABU4BL67_9NOCA|nr:MULTISPECIES: ABC transporter permease [Rhodococcus]MDZ7928997.1 ABC transporter permease [Rhodococcus sp. (in: high G+C Gram-positive bacteria)]MCJ0894510.1 ABC transporter permease [Rhodococcus sp. ARC_M5]MDI9896641.1 ABC transporter permease [Rhodococcus sp. IEGM 1381]MDV6264903.1 ABC transporter permease [Rhodococcus yunnanensis]MDV8021951.1 ABC transporter permease [Rhodococcus sp. IEGM 1330]
MSNVFLDSAIITKRNLIKLKRVPDLLFFAMLSPIMFVLLFAYVFGSAIDVPGIDYKSFLMGGIFVQTMIFGASLTGSSLAEDLQKGVMDRFRSLPMARSAVVIGRTAADVGNNLVTITIMSITGLIVGWRITSSFFDALLGYVLLLLFAYSISWVMALVGLTVRSPEIFNNASFIVIFPLTFIANTFVPIDNFPSVLKTIAEWNPISSVTLAVREQFGNTNPMAPPPEVWPLQNPVLYTLIWVVLMLVVFVPLSVRKYQKTMTA